MGNGNHKGASFAQLAGYLDGTAQNVYQLLDDGHTEPGAFHLYFRTGMLAGKFVKQMGQKFLAHADARIADNDPHQRIAGTVAGQLVYLEVDGAAGIRVLIGVGHKIYQDLPQFHHVAHDVIVMDVYRLGKPDVLVVHHLLEHGGNHGY